MATFVYPSVSIDTSLVASEATLSDVADSVASIDTKLTSQATATKQDTGNTSLSSIDTKLSSQATATKQDTGNTSLSSIDTKLSSQATATKQDTGNTSLASIDSKVPANLTVTSSKLLVDGSGVTQPVSDGGSSLTVDGTVAATQSGTWDIGTVGTITNVVHVDDNSSSLTVDDGGSSLTVDGTVTVQDGGGSITVDGTVAATQSGTWNVGTVTTVTNVVHVDDNAGSLTVDGTVAATQSGTWNVGTVSTVTNVVHVDDNAGSLTVDGTVAATQSGAWNVTNVSGTISLPTGASTSANQTTQIAATQRNVIDQIDTTPLLDTSSTNITASSGNPVAIVASLAAACYKIVSVEDIGSFIGLYTGAALSETLLCVLPLGGGEMTVNIPASTRISLRAMENTAISSGKIAINFIG